jgi:hypothetical protein
MTANVLVPATSPEDWQRLLAEPEKHWRRGYSAHAIAHSWHEADGFPEEIRDVLTRCPRFEDLELLMAIPEHQVPLPGGQRPSQNDVWALARGSHGLVSIAVEGKVSEPFGEPVGTWRENASEGKSTRLRFLCEELGLPYPPPDEIAYQLLHRTVSAIIEARRFLARDAIMLVHSFSASDAWFEDYDRFLSLFGVAARIGELVSVPGHESPALHLAWVRGNLRYVEELEDTAG